MKRNRFLVDTNVFIWWMEENKRLPKDLYKLLNDPNNQVFLSVASIWEIILKLGKKKLKLPQTVEEGISASGFKPLPIETAHVLAIRNLPNYHQDSFDRIIISQAGAEKLTVITSDKKIWKYKIDLLKF